MSSVDHSYEFLDRELPADFPKERTRSGDCAYAFYRGEWYVYLSADGVNRSRWAKSRDPQVAP